MEIFKKDIQYIKGVGPKKAEKLRKLGINTVEDMLWYFPRDYDDRRNRKKIKEMIEGEKTTLFGRIVNEGDSRKVRKNLTITKFKMIDDSGEISLVFFNKSHLKKVFNKGQYVMVNGESKKGIRGWEMINPVIERLDSSDTPFSSTIVPIYSTTEGLNQKELISIQQRVLSLIENNMTEYLPQSIIKKNRLCDIEFAIKNIHFPISIKALKVAKYRLVFEEFLLLQFGLLQLKKGFDEKKEGVPLYKNDGMEAFINHLPFKLTKAQQRVFKEISNDLEQNKPMNRLIQGDVGSGKTIIAILALLKAAINGYQGALMAPTEILAEQHFLSVSELLGPLGYRTALLVGSLSKKEKQGILEGIEGGDIHIVIGTHALIQEGVHFRKLGIVVTDEQHRFGVRQRAALATKGESPHVLVMSATPIPRTLALILYGDLDVSIIDELPPGRKKIKTYSRTTNKREEIYKFVKKQLNLGRQAYVVCPLVEESEVIEAQSAIEIAQELSEDLLFGYSVGLLHGKMNAKEKEQIMMLFKRGDIQVLVSTTVIEVGVNVPNATIMVVENAERFGLAQLHQLRGRVGRGDHQSYCILINNSKSEISRQRMMIMEESTDGFVISEKDLELRGPGEFFGVRQHGLPELRIANIFRHMNVLKKVQEQLKEMLIGDPDMLSNDFKDLQSKIREKFNLTEIDYS